MINTSVKSGFHTQATHVVSCFKLSFNGIRRAIVWQRGLYGVRIKTRWREFSVCGFQIGTRQPYGSPDGWSAAIHQDRRKND